MQESGNEVQVNLLSYACALDAVGFEYIAILVIVLLPAVVAKIERCKE